MDLRVNSSGDGAFLFEAGQDRRWIPSQVGFLVKPDEGVAFKVQTSQRSWAYFQVDSPGASRPLASGDAGRLCVDDAVPRSCLGRVGR